MPWKTISTLCASACRVRRRWRTGSTATHPAAWCSAVIARRWPYSENCSSRARSARLIGRSSRVAPTPMKVASTFPLSRRDDARGWWMKADEHGLPSASTWKVMGRAGGFSWLALEPLTGRTHQLRVHCAEMGWPIFGDSIYGGAPRAGGPPLHLHSREVTVPISKNKSPVVVTAPVPEHMRDKLGACGFTQ